MTLIKKLGAIAIGSILLASSVVPLAQSELTIKDAIAKLGRPGTDFWIVVGKDRAHVIDTLTAADIALRFAEFATVEEQIAGTKEYTVKGLEARLMLNTNSLTSGGQPALPTGELDNNVLPQLKKEYTVRVGTDSLTVKELVEVSNTTSLANNVYANSTLALGLNSAPATYLSYYIKVDGNLSNVNGDAGRLLKVRLGDNNFVISKVEDGSKDKVTLFDGFGPDWLRVGEERDIGNTGYKLTLTDVMGFGGDVVAIGKITDKSSGREYPFNVQISGGSPIPEIIEISDDVSFKIVLLSGVGFGDQKTARIVVGQEKVVADGDKYDEIFKWKVDYSSNTLKFGFDLKPENTTYVDVGKSIKLPGSKISLSNLGLTLTDKDYLATINVKLIDIDTTKVNATSCFSSAKDIGLEISNVPIYSGGGIYNNVYVLFKANNTNLDAKIAYIDSSSGEYKCFSSSDQLTLGPTDIILQPQYSLTSNKFPLTNNLEIEMDDTNKVISTVVGTSDYGMGISYNTANVNNTWVYTKYGHKVFVSSDRKLMKLSWTPIQGYLKVALGEVTEKVVGGGTIKKLDVQALQVPVGKFDTEVSTDSSLTKNLIVIGSPIVNRVAAALLNLPYGEFEPTRDYYANIGAYDPATDQGKGFIQAFDNIFNSGKVAILVAGWRGEDTRLSGSVLQLYDKFLSDLNRNAVIIGGTRESPTFLPAKTPETSTEGAE
ncbi:MAG: hypothetical protein QXT34_01065 [Candidatus Aenigmatarchaeota archaeon]